MMAQPKVVAELPTPFYVTFVRGPVGTVAAMMLTALTVKMMIFPIGAMMMTTAVVTRRRSRICWNSCYIICFAIYNRYSIIAV